MVFASSCRLLSRPPPLAGPDPKPLLLRTRRHAPSKEQSDGEAKNHRTWKCWWQGRGGCGTKGSGAWRDRSLKHAGDRYRYFRMSSARNVRRDTLESRGRRAGVRRLRAQLRSLVPPGTALHEPRAFTQPYRRPEVSTVAQCFFGFCFFGAGSFFGGSSVPISPMWACSSSICFRCA